MISIEDEYKHMPVRQTVTVPPTNSAPLGGTIDATTFRNIAKSMAPAVVNIQTLAHARGRELTRNSEGRAGRPCGACFGGGGNNDHGPAPPRGRGRAGQVGPQLQGAGTAIIDKTV